MMKQYRWSDSNTDNVDSNTDEQFVAYLFSWHFIDSILIRSILVPTILGCLLCDSILILVPTILGWRHCDSILNLLAIVQQCR